MKDVPPLHPNITLKDIQEEAMRFLQKRSKPDMLDVYEMHRVSEHSQITDPVPVITINDEIISTEGNLTTISGASKSGKSAFTSILIAGAISVDGIIDGLEFVNVQPNVNKKAVIHFDTEQAKHKHLKNIFSVLRRANMSGCDYLLSYNIRQLEIAQYTQMTSDICEGALQKFGGIHLLIIDGIADFITDVNDAEQSMAIVKYFEELAIKYRMPIIVIVHTNPGTDKERGHLGSQCQRKCESLLLVKTEGNISFIEPKLLRMAGKANIPAIQFMYDKDKGYHVGCGIRSVSEDKNETRLNSIKIICQQVFGGQTSLSYRNAISAIVEKTNKSIATAKVLFTDMTTHNMIRKEENGGWALNHDAS